MDTISVFSVVGGIGDSAPHAGEGEHLAEANDKGRDHVHHAVGAGEEEQDAAYDNHHAAQ